MKNVTKLDVCRAAARVLLAGALLAWVLAVYALKVG